MPFTLHLSIIYIILKELQLEAVQNGQKEPKKKMSKYDENNARNGILA
jgi:hypothetical protein